jgi:large subunit ribosomal protein L21|tara:strand:+ start:3411 stop:3725 length:315 start_codon:yes stop_codon:yes gene_type:complete
MYAIIETGGKQLKVEPGKRYFIEKLPQAVGEAVKFDQILLVKNDKKLDIGQPKLKASVDAVVVDQFRDEKIEILKHKRRKHHMKRQGHRQDLTCVEIKAINNEG